MFLTSRLPRPPSLSAPVAPRRRAICLRWSLSPSPPHSCFRRGEESLASPTSSARTPTIHEGGSPIAKSGPVGVGELSPLDIRTADLPPTPDVQRPPGASASIPGLSRWNKSSFPPIRSALRPPFRLPPLRCRLVCADARHGHGQTGTAADYPGDASSICCSPG